MAERDPFDMLRLAPLVGKSLVLRSEEDIDFVLRHDDILALFPCQYGSKPTREMVACFFGAEDIVASQETECPSN